MKERCIVPHSGFGSGRASCVRPYNNDQRILSSSSLHTSTGPNHHPCMSTHSVLVVLGKTWYCIQKQSKRKTTEISQHM